MPSRRRRALVAVAAALALAAPTAGRPGATSTPAAAQGGTYRLAHVGDISPPTNETRGDDNATAELLARLAPDGIATNGDNQYEYGALGMFEAATGFAGTYGRLVGERFVAPTMGNHDMTDGGNDGRAPGWSAYFAGTFDRLRDNAAAGRFPAMGCEAETPACRPDLGYYVVDLDADRNGQADWYIVAVNTECARPAGSTGDSASPSCANDSPMVNWLRAAMGARHGGATSGRKASIMVGHHEAYGTCFFNDDRDATGANRQRYLLQVWQHFHGDLNLRGHTHSTGRWGPLLWDGTPSTSGSRHIASGAGGRSLTPCRVSGTRPGLRYRNDTKYGIGLLTLTVSYSPAGWQGGSWHHEFHYVDGTRADAAAAGVWP